MLFGVIVLLVRILLTVKTLTTVLMPFWIHSFYLLVFVFSLLIQAAELQLIETINCVQHYSFRWCFEYYEWIRWLFFLLWLFSHSIEYSIVFWNEPYKWMKKLKKKRENICNLHKLLIEKHFVNCWNKHAYKLLSPLHFKCIKYQLR